MKDRKQDKDRRDSKYLSLILRHDPGKIGIELDENGWVAIDDLLTGLNRKRRGMSRARLEYLVETSDKKRYAISEDGLRISANQGHSVTINLNLAPLEPPETLFHGTVARFLDAINEQGLIKGSRHHVHLSADLETATKVGGRRGRPVILTVQAKAMHDAGHVFYRSDNGVWLTDQVPPEYLDQ